MLATIAFSWVSPVILTVYLGFTNLSIENFLAFIKDFATPAVRLTLENFQRIFMGGDPYIHEVLKITVLFVSSVLLINAGYALILSIALAYLIRNEILSIILRISWLIPRIMPGIIYALVWNWFIDPEYGLLNTLLSTAGTPKEWLPSSWLLQRPYSQILMIWLTVILVLVLV